MKTAKITQEERLVELYCKTPRALDRLPYTEEFAVLHAQYLASTGDQVSMQEMWEHLTALRKAKHLPRKGR